MLKVLSKTRFLQSCSSPALTYIAKSIIPSSSCKQFQIGRFSGNSKDMGAADENGSSVRPSKRVRMTDDPCIVTMQNMLRGKEGIMSLAQGIVHWGPPPSVVAAVTKAAEEPDSNLYGADDGIAKLKESLFQKLRLENGIDGVELMVTAGANQAYANVVLALLDAEDGAVLFAPYYFNHMMALQMTGGSANVDVGPIDRNSLPDVQWLESRLAKNTAEAPPVRMVTIVNPCNPTGIMLPKEHLESISAVCAKYKTWLVVDNTYEYFSYEDEGFPSHTCVSGDNVINIFSFSKAYGMMGWRVGYFSYPPKLHGELMKVQDTIAICPAIMSQKAALAALEFGNSWVRERVRSLSENRKIVIGAIEASLGKDSISGGSGAIYLIVKLPLQDDMRIVEWLNDKHKVCVIPGSACGAPGTVRVCYANLPVDRCREATARLRAGLEELAQKGASALHD